MKKNNPQIVKSSRVKSRDEEGDENYSTFIPLDLIIEILAKLPLKSVARLILVSKLWYDTIRGKCFKDLFWTRSLTRPCFLIAFRCDEDWFFHTASHESPSSLHSTTSTILNKDHQISQPIRGLICARKASKMVICNPCTGQVAAALPNVKTRRRSISTFLGYDSVEHVHKILCMTVLNVSLDHEAVVSEEHQVLTLGDQKKRWRKIECQYPHCPATKGLFINGVIYYGAWSNSYQRISFIVGFDVRLEEFSLVKLPNNVEMRPHGRSELVEYLGKIALVVEQSLCGQFHLRVLEDVEKQEWSTIYIAVPSWKDLVREYNFRCMGTISTGELIFAPLFARYPHPFFIVYYDLKKDKARRVEVEGAGGALTDDRIFFLDHVVSLD